MLELYKVRKRQGEQAIPDLRKAEIRAPFRGLPVIKAQECGNCRACLEICPTGAITSAPLNIDLGKCIFCGDCARECPQQAITFTTGHKIASNVRAALRIEAGRTPEYFCLQAMTARPDLARIFGRSLKLRQVSAAGCNGCEWELNACGNVNFDMGRFGIEFVASPRHADGILITGPISENMAPALEDAYQCTPEPKIVILAGTCAISGGVFQPSPALQRDFLDRHQVDLYLPGCPVHPLTVINGVSDLLGK